jgi:hypothetical protein
MSDTRPVKPKPKPNGRAVVPCKHNPNCSLFESIEQLSGRFDALAQQIAEERSEERRRASEDKVQHAGDIYDLRGRLTLLEQREERLAELLRDATRAMGENKAVMAAATLAIQEARKNA